MDRKRVHDAVDTTEMSDDTPGVLGKRSRAGYPHFTFVSDKEMVKGRAHWRDPRLNDKWNAVGASPLGSVDAVISASEAHH